MAVSDDYRCIDCGWRFLTATGLDFHRQEAHVRRPPAFLSTSRTFFDEPEPIDVPPGRTVSGSLLSMVQTRGNRCHWCRKPFVLNGGSTHPQAPTREHLVPKSLGRNLAATNVRLVHNSCNNLRGIIEATAFRRLMMGEALTREELWPHVFAPAVEANDDAAG